ncbi:MAG: ethanolamine ammonia-lyase reactivating factor EutA [Promethearchaeota archaeon]
MENHIKGEKQSEFKNRLESTKDQMISIVEMTLKEKYPTKTPDLMKSFIIQYEVLINKYKDEDITDLLRYYRITSQYKPALETILDQGKDLNDTCTSVERKFDEYLSKLQNKKEEKGRVSKKRPKVELKYFCSICNQSFDIPPDMKRKIEESSEKIVLPKHHDKEMDLKIVRNEPKEFNDYKKKIESRKHNFEKSNRAHRNRTIKDQDVNVLKVLSVGIDIGSSTSHLIFSRLTLKREFSFLNKTNRFKLVNREIVYEGDIIFTPLLDDRNIDTEKLIDFFRKEYEKAKITPEMVDTGAVIVTGETAKKNNAADIVEKISSESGKFVSASAGPNFESMLGIMGSGMVEESKQLQKTIMNVDIGGGTSNIAIASNGEVLSTSCINVGGRLLGINNNFEIWRIDEPTEWILKELELNYILGDIIPEEDVLRITKEYAKALLEVMQGPATCPIAKMLMMTEDIIIKEPIDNYSFSGGVAEYIYERDDRRENEGETANLNPYDDIGIYLANEIKSLIKELQLPIIEPKNKIRATVIGAGAFSLSVSGSTCYWDESVKLPVNNIPVVPINLDYSKFFFGGYQNYLEQKIGLALKNFNLVEGEDDFALYFRDHVNQSAIVPFASSFEKVFANSIKNNRLILIVLGEDGGKMLGLTIKRETSIKENLLCLDELELETGDWIDVGAPLNTGVKKTFPITKKSLVFNHKQSKTK